MVNASADVPLLFMQIFGQRKATVTAAATATRTDSRIMLVIDRSGSMASDAVDGRESRHSTDAVSEAIAFADSLEPRAATRSGLVVFDGSCGAWPIPPTLPGTYTTTPSAAASPDGPDSCFNTIVSPATVGPVVARLLQTTAASTSTGSTNTAEALWLAYVELQEGPPAGHRRTALPIPGLTPSCS